MPLMFRTVGYISEGCIFFNHAKRRLRMLLSNIIPTFRLLFVCARISINFDCFYMEMYAFNTFCLHTSPCYNVMLGKSMFFHHERLLQRIQYHGSRSKIKVRKKTLISEKTEQPLSWSYFTEFGILRCVTCAQIILMFLYVCILTSTLTLVL